MATSTSPIPNFGHHALLAVEVALRLKRKSPVAIVLPTTHATLKLAKMLHKRGEATPIRGDVEIQPFGIQVDHLLADLSNGCSPNLLIFSDQLVSASDATILIRTATTSTFVSPLELILNRKYGYELQLWRSTGLHAVAAQIDDPESIYRHLLTYLSACSLLGDIWLARRLQVQRLPEMRLYIAKRKARMFRSAIFDLYLRNASQEDLKRMIGLADLLDDQIERSLGAAC